MTKFYYSGTAGKSSRCFSFQIFRSTARRLRLSLLRYSRIPTPFQALAMVGEGGVGGSTVIAVSLPQARCDVVGAQYRVGNDEAVYYTLCIEYIVLL